MIIFFNTIAASEKKAVKKTVSHIDWCFEAIIKEPDGIFSSPATSQSRLSSFLNKNSIILDQLCISIAVYFLGRKRQGKPMIAMNIVIKIKNPVLDSE